MTTQAALNNLGALLARNGEWAEAEAICRKALEESEAALGLEHERTHEMATHVADMLEKLGKVEEAEALLQRVSLESDDDAEYEYHQDAAGNFTRTKVFSNHSAT